MVRLMPSTLLACIYQAIMLWECSALRTPSVNSSKHSLAPPKLMDMLCKTQQAVRTFTIRSASITCIFLNINRHWLTSRPKAFSVTSLVEEWALLKASSSLVGLTERW
ncbi:hypothetical protein CLU79DRAFT_758626 [Phycomyces nitens]|nr:hypothetical protein CLU79DRAFT_758626 [Phycomyces nitens]